MSAVDASSSTLFFTGSPDELASAQLEHRFLIISCQWTSIGTRRQARMFQILFADRSHTSLLENSRSIRIVYQAFYLHFTALPYLAIPAYRSTVLLHLFSLVSYYLEYTHLGHGRRPLRHPSNADQIEDEPVAGIITVNFAGSLGVPCEPRMHRNMYWSMVDGLF